MTTPKHLFTIVADDIRQEMGGKMSLMGIYDNHIVVPEVPYILPKVCFYVKFTSVEGAYKFSFSVKNPDDSKRTIIEGSEVQIPEGAKEGSFNVVASPFEVEAEGIYNITITLTQDDQVYEHTNQLAISDARRLRTEFEAIQMAGTPE